MRSVAWRMTAKSDEATFNTEPQKPLDSAFAVGVVKVGDQVAKRWCLPQVFGFHCVRIDRKAVRWV